MSTLNGSTYRKTVSRSVYSDSLLPERRNGFPSTPQPPMSYLEPPPRAPSRARTPTEVAAVDPTLEDAQKAGNNYHITMSLNAALAEAGLPASVAMATGRRSQMEYATNSRAQSEYATNSRAQSEYATNSQRGSRLGFVPQMAQPRTNERPGSVSVVRVTGDDVMRVTGNDVMRVTGTDGVRVTGNDVVAHAHFSFPVTQPRDDHVIVNEAYTIKSVQPSSVTHTETLTTVERPKSRVGFDLELFGGQTTVVTETTSSASDQQNNSGRNNSGSVATLTKSQRSSTNIASLPKATPRASTNSSNAVPQPTPRVSSHIGALSKATPRPSSNGDNWNSTSEWTEVREESNHKRSGQQQKKAKPDQNRQFWNPGDSTKHISENQVIETRMQRPSGVGSGVKGSRSDEYGAMSGGGDAVDGYESIEYETVRDNPWMIREMEGGEDEDESLIIYRGLAKGADASTVRQEVIYGEKEMEIVRQKNGRIQQDLLNVDIVSENVTVVVGNNLAQMSIMVRTERIVPIDDSKELFQKSSVTVTRLIEVDMMATPERERIYNQVLHSQRGGQGLTLSQKQTFDLYKAFLRLTETDSGHALHEQVRIDKETDQARLTDLDLKRDYNIDLDPVSTSSRRHTGYSRGFPN